MATPKRTTNRSTTRSRAKAPAPKRVVTTSAGNVRLQAQRAKTQRKPSAKYVVAELAVPGKGFVGFLRERAVVGLAIGFVVATQMQTLIKQLISSFLDPMTKLLFSQKLSEKTATLHYHGRSADFGWGQFIYAFIYFLFVLFAVYLIVKFFQLDKLDKKKED